MRTVVAYKTSADYVFDTKTEAVVSEIRMMAGTIEGKLMSYYQAYNLVHHRKELIELLEWVGEDDEKAVEVNS